MHYAAAQGHADIIQLLAKAGAKLVSDFGKTQGGVGDEWFVGLILPPLSPNQEAKDKDGETPYNVAGKNLKIRKLIQQLIDAKIESEDPEEPNGGGNGEEEEWEEAEAEEAEIENLK